MGLDKVLVLAQNPGLPDKRKDGHRKAGSTISRVMDWMDYVGVQYDFQNTYPHRGTFSKKDIDYDRLNNITDGYDRIIALGNIASEALTKIGVKHFKLPHPSGLNRQINDKKYIKQVLRECHEYCNR